MDEHFYNNIERLIKLEQQYFEQSSAALQHMINRGVQNIDQLDHIADRLLDTTHGLTGKGEDMYRQYLDYFATFNPNEAKKRKDDLEYDLGYKTHMLHASAILCKKELEHCTSPDGRSSFEVVLNDYVPNVYDVLKKAASFLFFAHYSNGRNITELMTMLRTITEETDYVLKRVEEFEDLMHYPNETYHPLREDEWQLIQTISEHNIQLYEQRPELNKDLMHNVFGK